MNWMNLTLEEIIKEYKSGDGCKTPLTRSEVNDLTLIISAKINLHEGNITEEEYEHLLDCKAEEKVFPNGFSSWHETHFEISEAIGKALNDMYSPDELQSEVVVHVVEEHGTGGIYDLAEDLTDEFELKFEGKEWDGEYFDEIEKFINEKLYNNTK